MIFDCEQRANFAISPSTAGQRSEASFVVLNAAFISLIQGDKRLSGLVSNRPG